MVGGVTLGALVAGLPGAGGGLLAGAPWSAWPFTGRSTAAPPGDGRPSLAPFPEEWREGLLKAYDHFERLPDDWRGRFEADVRLFLSEKRITGVGRRCSTTTCASWWPPRR